MGDEQLDNPVWEALGSYHAPLAETHRRARRYRPEVSMFAAVDHPDEESFADLAVLTGPGGYCLLGRDELPDPPPVGWEQALSVPGVQLVLPPGGLAPVAFIPEARPLGDDDVAAMLELVALTEPGPFNPRTIDMGGYLGVFDGDRLVAMAGERFRLEGRTEISAVCTHPEARGRGLATGLVAQLVAGIEARGEQAIMHAARSNTPAIDLYEHLGFVHRRDVDFAVYEAPA